MWSEVSSAGATANHSAAAVTKGSQHKQAWEEGMFNAAGLPASDAKEKAIAACWQSDEIHNSMLTLQVPFAACVAATNNFAPGNTIGEGATGLVYTGSELLVSRRRRLIEIY